MLELKHLKTIVAIAENGSLVLAAEKLFLTQSALSHQLKEIESRLGVSLFIRKSRPVRLTAAGERLLRSAYHDQYRTRYAALCRRRGRQITHRH